MIKVLKKLWGNEFFRGGIFFTVSSFIVNALNYFFNFIAGRSLGPKGYGEIATLFSYSSIATVPILVLSTFLIQKISSSTKQIAYTQSLEQLFWLKIKKWWFLFILLILIVPLLPTLTNLSLLTSSVLILLIIFSFLSAFYGAALQGLKLFFCFSLIGIAGTFLKFTGAIFVMFGVDGVTTVLLFLLLSGLLGYFSSRFFIQRQFRKKLQIMPAKIERSILHLLKSPQFLTIFSSTLALTLFNNIDIVFVKKFFSPLEAGIYSSWSLFAKIIFYALGPLISISFVFFASKIDKKAQNITLNVSLILLCVVGVTSYIFYKNFTHFIILLIFGKKFEAVSPYLAHASIFGTFYAGITFINNFFLAKNSKSALILPILIPLYIMLLFFVPKKLSFIINLDIFFSAVVMIVYLGAYFLDSYAKSL